MKSKNDKNIITLDSVNNAPSVMKDKIIQDLEDKCFQLSTTMTNLLTKLSDKELEISHLKKMLDSLVPKNQAIKIEISDEELIADMQIRRIKEASMQRDLSLEEAKKLDIYVKTKRLVKGDSTTIVDTPLPKNVDKKDLLRIAGAKIKDEQ